MDLTKNKEITKKMWDMSSGEHIDFDISETVRVRNIMTNINLLSEGKLLSRKLKEKGIIRVFCV